MATIEKRGPGAWRAKVRLNGQNIGRTFDTEALAKTWADKTEDRIRGGAKAAQIVKTPSNMTVAALFDRYAEEVSPGKGGGRWEIVRLRALRRAPEFQIAATAIDGADLAVWRDGRLKTVKASTVNRDLNLISAVFSRAIFEWRLALGKNPVSDMQRPPQPKHRDRRVSDDERDAVVLELGWDGKSAPADLNEWAAWAFVFALETAMRQGEILGMRKGNVHPRHVHLPKTKNGDARNVPLSTKALALLALLPQGGVGERVVPLESGTCGAYFRAAARGAGIRDLHFHDARHEAITRFAAKLSIMELARVSGHRDTRMLLGYYHPDPGDLAGKLG